MIKNAILLISMAAGIVNAKVVTENFGDGANAFSIYLVEIGNPGNAADLAGNPKPAGSIPYSYYIGKYEISRDMINKANALASLGISLADFSISTSTIPYRGGNGSDRPAPGISWYDAAKFVNWLNTSRGYQPAYKFNTSGVFQSWGPLDSGYNANNIFRNSNAKFFLPSIDEWYKAAYYDPNKNAGQGAYWIYPTQSNSAPSYSSGGTAPNSAVYGGQTSPADIFNAGGLSAYGTMAQGGNLWEWMETANDLTNTDPSELRAIRGGGFYNINTDAYQQSNYVSWGSQPNDGNIKNGFRIAMSVPEPSEYSYLISNQQVTIISYNGASSSVTIPNAMNGLPVTKIGNGAFRWCQTLTTIVIPESVTNIEEYAFQGCPVLRTVVFNMINPPIIASSAFEGGALLKTALYPEESSVGWKSIEVANVNLKMGGISGVFAYSINNGKVTIIRYLGGTCLPYVIDVATISVVIPREINGMQVVSIGGGDTFWDQGAFSGLSCVSGVTIPNTVTNIEGNAFDGCFELTSISIPDSVVSIGKWAFRKLS